MGILFENVVPFDIERTKRQLTEEKERGIRIFVETCQELGESQEKTVQRMQEKFEVGETEAFEKVKHYWRK